MDAKDFLEQVEHIEKRIENKLCERQQWEDLAYKLAGNSGESIVIRNRNGKLELHNAEKVQSSGKQDSMATAVIMCLTVVETINGVVAELVKKKNEVTETIEKLRNATEYDILFKRYIQHLELKDIANIYGYEYSWATTTHGRAMANLQRILDKKEKAVG